MRLLLYLSKASSRRPSSMFSSGSHVLCLQEKRGNVTHHSGIMKDGQMTHFVLHPFHLTRYSGWPCDQKSEGEKHRNERHITSKKTVK